MKFNWGIGIALFYGSFMVILLYFVFKSGSYDHSLVMNDYYEQDLKYQQHYDKIANSMSLSEKIELSHNDSKQLMTVKFPASITGIEGKVLFFRPSTSKLDLSHPILLNPQNEMQIPTKALKRGRWTIKIDWTAAGNSYYKESEIVL